MLMLPNNAEPRNLLAVLADLPLLMEITVWALLIKPDLVDVES